MAKIKIPLEIVEIDANSYHIFLSAVINDVNRDILIDTGASRTVFNQEYMSATTNIEADEVVSSGLGPGKIDTTVGLMKNFLIGDHEWHDVKAIFMDFSHINELYQQISNKQIAGLIGGDFLYSTKARIDYRKSEIIFFIPSKKRNIFG